MKSQPLQIIDYIVGKVFQKPDNTRQLITEIAADLNFVGKPGSLQSKVIAMLKKPEKLKHLHINQIVQTMFIMNFSTIGHAWNQISKAGTFVITTAGKISSFESHDGRMRCENDTVTVQEPNPRRRMRAPDQKPASEYRACNFGGRHPALLYQITQGGNKSVKNSAKDFLFFLHSSVNKLSLPIFDQLLEEIELKYEDLSCSSKQVNLGKLRKISSQIIGDATKNAKEKEEEEEEKGETILKESLLGILICCLTGTEELEDIVEKLLELHYPAIGGSSLDTIDIDVLVNSVRVFFNTIIEN
ncbi:hypothetical protein CAEBREN_13922 [Caenorhabditis brenneri]|uniref:SPK domain-containing protein n=1 Tax=Caenorhabditis brenneri TaxID=135651 RepID=G0N4D7_CAEBE|nr:hypothetical protein CAEBREN_13922 [Caenorhabditis brenneri]